MADQKTKKKVKKNVPAGVAHIKASLTNNQISLSVEKGKLLLGVWQGIYLFEHRLSPQTRTIIHHFLGEI